MIFSSKMLHPFSRSMKPSNWMINAEQFDLYFIFQDLLHMLRSTSKHQTKIVAVMIIQLVGAYKHSTWLGRFIHILAVLWHWMKDELIAFWSELASSRQVWCGAYFTRPTRHPLRTTHNSNIMLIFSGFPSKEKLCLSSIQDVTS
jgi:hypothetical protein